MGKDNAWFKSAEIPCTAIAHILMTLDEKGVIADDMREAIYLHANNNLGALPRLIACAASSLAAAVAGGVGLDNSATANAAWAIASLAEQMHGWHELEYCFNPKNTDAKVTTS